MLVVKYIDKILKRKIW